MFQNDITLDIKYGWHERFYQDVLGMQWQDEDLIITRYEVFLLIIMSVRSVNNIN